MIAALCIICLVITSPSVRAENLAEQQKNKTVQPLGQVSADTIGRVLQSSMIWIPEDTGKELDRKAIPTTTTNSGSTTTPRPASCRRTAVLV